MTRTIGTNRWSLLVNETEAHGEGRVHLNYRQGNKTLAVSLEGARELAEILPAILAMNEYPELSVVQITEPGEEVAGGG